MRNQLITSTACRIHTVDPMRTYLNESLSVYYIYAEEDDEWIYDPATKNQSPKTWKRGEIIEWLSDRHISVIMDDCDISDGKLGSPRSHIWAHYVIEMEDVDIRWVELRMRFW